MHMLHRLGLLRFLITLLLLLLLLAACGTDLWPGNYYKAWVSHCICIAWSCSVSSWLFCCFFFLLLAGLDVTCRQCRCYHFRYCIYIYTHDHEPDPPQSLLALPRNCNVQQETAAVRTRAIQPWAHLLLISHVRMHSFRALLRNQHSTHCMDWNMGRARFNYSTSLTCTSAALAAFGAVGELDGRGASFNPDF